MTMTASDLAVGRHACGVACLTTLPSVRLSVRLSVRPSVAPAATRRSCCCPFTPRSRHVPTATTPVTQPSLASPSACRSASTHRDAKHRRRRVEWAYHYSYSSPGGIRWEGGIPKPTRGSAERHKLPQRGLGCSSPGEKRFFQACQNASHCNVC